MRLNKKSYLKYIIIISTIVLNIGCDQISKSLLREKVNYYERIALIDNIFTLTKVENSGAFLGMGSELNPIIKNIFLLGLPSIVMIGLIIYVFIGKKLSMQYTIGLCFIIGGGIGNIYDRIAFGSVTDFFHIKLGVFKTGIFNMADVSVMVGTGLLLLISILERKQEKSHN